jgi:alkylation response protein AidB-like acyl-CoA dehydrogenase
MNFGFSSEQLALRDSVRTLARSLATPTKLRALWQTETGRDQAAWHALAEIGVAGLIVPEAWGGGGGDELDLFLVLEELGKACWPDEIVNSCLVAPYLLVSAGSEDLRERWLPRLASGEARAAVGLSGSGIVADAHVSDLVLINVSGRVVAFTREEVNLQPLVSMDPSRRLSHVTQVHAAGEDVGPADAPMAQARQAVGTASLLIGIASRLLDLTTSYVKVRNQFGRPIGSFQAVKHQLAHAVSLNSLSRNAAVASTWKVARSDVDAHDAALLALLCAVEAEAESNRVALQLHGGVGFTWEHDLQLWLKRGKALEQACGGRRQIAETVGRGAHPIIARIESSDAP